MHGVGRTWPEAEAADSQGRDGGGEDGAGGRGASRFGLGDPLGWGWELKAQSAGGSVPVTPEHATRRGQQGVTAARQGGAQRSRPGHSDVREGGLGGHGRGLGAHSPRSHRSCTPGEPAALCSPVRGWAWGSPDRLAPPTVPISQLRRRSAAGAGSGSMSPPCIQQASGPGSLTP